MSITLHYWASEDGKTLRGTAEKLRFMLNQCEFQYEDKPATQADLDAMMAAKKIVCGQFPVLQVGDEYYEMSAAIMEHIAKMKGEYLGSTQKRGHVRAICNTVVEFENQLDTKSGKKNPKPDAIIKKYFAIFDKILVANDDGDPKTEDYCCGNEFTFADVALAAAVNAVTQLYGFMQVRPYTKLKEIHDKIVASPAFEARISSRSAGF